LTALRRLDSDTPAPTEPVLERAFSALAERMDAAEQADRPIGRHPVASPVPRGGRRKLVSIWTTAVVAAAVAVVAVIAIQEAPHPSPFNAGAPAVPSTTSSASATPSPTATSSASATASAKPDYEFDLSDPHDVARGKSERACYRDHGVKIVELTEPDAHGVSFIAYGGPHDDQQSIARGLQYQAVCTAAGSAAD